MGSRSCWTLQKAFTVGPTSGTTATITHEGQASFTGIVTATSYVPSHRTTLSSQFDN